jgi:hypothetical protein
MLRGGICSRTGLFREGVKGIHNVWREDLVLFDKLRDKSLEQPKDIIGVKVLTIHVGSCTAAESGRLGHTDGNRFQNHCEDASFIECLGVCDELLRSSLVLP